MNADWKKTHLSPLLPARAQEADLAGLSAHRVDACCGGEVVAVGVAVDPAGDGEELRGQGGPMPGRLGMRAGSGWRSSTPVVRLSIKPGWSRAVSISVARPRIRSAATASPGTLICWACAACSAASVIEVTSVALMLFSLPRCGSR